MTSRALTAARVRGGVVFLICGIGLCVPSLSLAQGTVLFRVNAGGPLVASGDAGPDWAEDSSANPSPLHNSGSNTAAFSVTTADTSVPAGTPIALFQSERWDPTAAPEMAWSFSVGIPGTYEVRLYLANGYSGTQSVGQRVFDVAIEGAIVLDDYDIVADVGHLVGTMKSFVVSSDGDLNVEFFHIVENPLIDGIEILALDPDGLLQSQPSALDFGLVEVATTSSAQAVTLTNLGQPGDASITLTNVSVAGEFAHTLALQTLAPGASVAFDVTFQPTLAGNAAGTLTIQHDGANSPATIGLTGQGFDPGAPPISFGSSNLGGESLSNPTSLDFGPDGRLFVSQQNGLVLAYSIARNGPNDYQVTATETIGLVRSIPNHDDDGSLNSGQTNRQVTGLLATGSAANPVLYVTSSDPRIGAGGGGNDSNLDTNSGIISRLTWNGLAWEIVQIVRGLPRSEENHATNGMTLDPATNTLYVMQGGHANKGAPSNNFAQTPEYALSAALLSVDLNAIEALPILTDAQGQDYILDLATLDDPTRAGDPDPGDPFGGNDGRNQAIIDPGGPVQVYSPGYRNAYDVVLTEAGRLYTIDNGPNSGWGGLPIGEGTPNCTNETNEATSTGYGDGLHYISGPGYYGGHPHPTRANPETSGLFIYQNDGGVWTLVDQYDWQTDFPVPPVPFGTGDAVQCDYRIPGVEDGALAVISASTNGITEYTASNFAGALQGDLLAASFDGNIYRFELNAAGDDLVNPESALFSGFGSQPLDVTAQSDGEIFPGTVWVAVFGSGNIAVFEPLDFAFCSGADDPGLDEDSDGFTNADEIDNGTDPCNGGSKPDDNDGDLVSDLNDADDDNDGIPDPQDAFAIDPANGTTTDLPVRYPFFNADPGSGFFGLGFTGLMINGTSDWLSQFDETKLAAGGAAGLFTTEEVTAGDAFQADNDQDNAFQFGVNVDTTSPIFSVQTRLQSPYFEVSGGPTTPIDFQSFGMFLGTGDQDNYLKLVFNAQGGSGGAEVLLEENGVATGTSYATTVVGNILGSIFVDLYFTVDPAARTVQSHLSLDGGPRVDLGSPLTIPAAWLDPLDAKGLAVGVIATSSGSGTPFGATWDLFELTPGPAGDECIVDADCDDGDPCTADSCSSGACDNGSPVDGDADGVCDGADNCPATANPSQADGDTDGAGDACDPCPADALDDADADGACADADNCPFAANPDQADGDSDGIGDVCDLCPVLTGAAEDAGLGSGGWVTRAPNTVARHESGLVEVDDLIYLIGSEETALTEIYDPSTDNWTTGPSLPVVLDHVQPVVVEGKIYVIGGLTAFPGPSVDTVYVLDPANLGAGWQTRTPLPTTRGAQGCAADGTKIYCAGGLSSAAGNTAIDVMEAYDTRSDSWSTLAPMPRVRDHFHAQIIDGKFHAVSGRDTTIASTFDFHDVYDIATNTWSPAAPLPTPRGGYASAVLNGRLLILGGEGGGPSNGTFPQVEEYDTVRDSWRTLADLPTPRHGMGAAISDAADGITPRLYVISGGPAQGGSSSAVNEVFSFELQDVDLDAVAACLGDCDDGNAAVWATPGDTLALTASHDRASGETTLAWSAPAAPGGAAWSYDTLRSASASDFATPTCVETSGADTTTLDTETPAPGALFHYLTRAVNACPSGVGPLGQDSAGQFRAGGGCP